VAEFAVFLRGVNVGGITIRMAELREALSVLPVSGVKTLLASGNAVLSTDLDGTALKDRVEETLRAAFGYDAWVIVLARQDVEALVRSCPYPSDDPGVHAYVTLSSDAAALDRLVALLDGHGADEAAEDGAHVRLGPVALAWRCPKGSTLDAPLSKATAKPIFKATTTTRNLRTLQKVEAAFG
jgi:uncharacterized protein (DUF1697 family)